MEALLGVVSNPQHAKGVVKQLAQAGVNSATIYQKDQTESLADPFAQMAQRNFAGNPAVAFLRGRIVDTMPTGYMYRVLLEAGQFPRYGVLLNHSALNQPGAKATAQLPIGSHVLCAVYGAEPIVTILGAVPTQYDGAAVAMSAVLHQATRQGVDTAYTKAYRSDPSLASYAAGRLFDTCGSGEYGAITETGIRLHLDSFMATLGLDEASGLYFFYEDMLTRLAAYNYQHWTAVKEHWSWNDEGELSEFTGRVVYPWEMLGQMQKQIQVTVQKSQTWQLDEPHLGKVELNEQKAVPLYRLLEWFGYLGQGGKKSVAVYLSNAVGRSGEPLPLVGVADESCSLLGQQTQQSVSGLSFIKPRALITPQQKQLPDDSDGDTSDVYKANGKDGPKLRPEPQFATTSRISKSMQRILGICDYNTYLTNYAHLYPFLQHKKDYHVPEAKTVTPGSQISYAALFGKQHIDTDTFSKNVYVDENYGTVPVPTTSGALNILPDGNFVITGPAGETIRSLNGSIEISAPGDVLLKTGRSTHVIAGRDATIRARQHVELSATERDVRVKAEQNLQMLAGNGGYGGVVIESRGAGLFDVTKHGDDVRSGGVLIRAKSGDCVLHGNSVYARATSGDIVLDAAKGGGNFVVYATKETVFTSQGVDYFFNTAGDVVSGPVARISPSGNVFEGLTFLNGALYVGGEIIGESNLRIAGFGMQSGSEYWGKIQNVRQLTQLIEKQRQFYTDDYPQSQGQSQYDGVFTNRFYAVANAGQDDVVAHFGFSFRTDQQYYADGYLIYEAPWEQTVRVTSQPSVPWVEKPVIVSAGQTTVAQPRLYPFPGLKAFTSEGYVQQDTTLFDHAQNLPKDRVKNGEIAGIYDDARYAEPKIKPLNQFPTF